MARFVRNKRAAAYGEGVAKALGISLEEALKSTR